MLKSLATLAAFLCLGSPSLPPVPAAVPDPAPLVACTSISPEILQYVPVCTMLMGDPTAPDPTIKDVLKQLAKVGHKINVPLDPLIKKYARKYGVDEKLVRAVMRQESGGSPLAVSPKGAMGIMQLMPETAASLGVENAFDPEENVSGGVRYLKHCLKRFQQDVVLALAAYNAGPEAVEKHGGVPPYQETENYVASITQAYTGKPWTRENKPAPAASPAPVKKEAGLDWDIPKPAWKIIDPRVKVAAPRWKMKSPGLSQVPPPLERQTSYSLDQHGLRPENTRRSKRTTEISPPLPYKSKTLNKFLF